MIWGQILTTIPKSILTKKFSVGRKPPEDLIVAPVSMWDDGKRESYAKDKGSGRILWVRGIKRLQHQVSFIKMIENQLAHFTNFISFINRFRSALFMHSERV